MAFKIELTGDTIAELLEAVNELSTNMIVPFYNPELDQTKPVEPINKPAKEPERAKKEEPKPEPEPEAPGQKKVTKNDIKQAMLPILRSKRDELKEAFKSFGVNSLGELDEADYPAFLKKIEAL